MTPTAGVSRTTWIVLALLAVLALLVAIGAALLFDGAVLSRGDAATEQLPPSERGRAPTTTLPRVVDEANDESEAARSGDRFKELTCDFVGTSTLEPGLSTATLFGGTAHDMALEDGAEFSCTDGTTTSAGSIELDARFEELSALNGVASGTGRITWSELAASEGVVGLGQAPSSDTVVEVQLDYPVIVVWTTITDGPYAGYRGKLVLRNWEQIYDADDLIVGIEFAPTSAVFAPT